MINRNDLPKRIEKQFAYENRTFLRAFLPIEQNEFIGATYEVSHNGRVYSYPGLDAAIKKFNEEVNNHE